MKTLPNYRTEPGIVGDLTDLIMDRAECKIPNDARRIPWISSYQGETDYEVRFGHLCGRRISFRYGKVPWRWSYQKEGERYWNWDSEDRFQREMNGAWGIVHCSGDPLDAETLTCFRELYVPEAVTGYFEHAIMGWVICEPTTQRLGLDSWRRSKSYQEFIAENPQYAQAA